MILCQTWFIISCLLSHCMFKDKEEKSKRKNGKKGKNKKNKKGKKKNRVKVAKDLGRRPNLRLHFSPRIQKIEEHYLYTFLNFLAESGKLTLV